MNEQQIVELLKKYRKGTLNDDEKSKLETWYLHEADTKKQMLTESEEAEISNLIRSRLPLVLNKQPILIRRINVVAAAIALIICSVGMYVFVDSRTPLTTKIEDFSTITPGSNKATLTLADGTKINLSDAMVGNLSNQSGVRIVKENDGNLVYDDLEVQMNSESQLQWNKIEVPIGGQWKVKLSDGSLVFLNSQSTIIYPTKFVGDERKVYITGEAYFEVAHDEMMPFKVKSHGQLIEVHGTHFNVMAYEGEKSTKTTLLEGSVNVLNLATQVSHFLKPGEQALVAKNNIKVLDNVDVEEAVAWKEGYFKFNEDLESIMNKIARWYDVEVDYQEGVNRSKKFAGKISRSKDISSTLRIMELTGTIQFKIEGRRIIVMK